MRRKSPDKVRRKMRDGLVAAVDLRPPTVDELVSRWLSGEDHTMADAIIPPLADPEAAWQAVLRIMGHELSEEQKARLAAGPMEDLLVWHAATFIDRIEAEAQRSAAFAYVLRGVWRRNIPQEVWNRVVAVRGEGAI